MKRFRLILLILLYNLSLFGQSFEGELTYVVEYEFDKNRLEQLGISKEDILNKLKNENDYYDKITIYLKEGNYLKKDNSNSRKKFVYLAAENLIYCFLDDSKITIIDGEKFSALNTYVDDLEVQTSKVDSIKVINNDTCQLIRLTYGEVSEEFYWYSKDKLKINPVLFEKHNYEYFNKILNESSSYPIEITKRIRNFILIRMTLENYEQREVDDNVFKIPDLEKSNDEEDLLLKKMTGNEVLKIKENKQ